MPAIAPAAVRATIPAMIAAIRRGRTLSDRVASAVGRLSVNVFGLNRIDGVALAFHLGLGGLRIGLVRRLMLQLRPDLLELRLDHRRRHVEIVAGRQLVEQLALHVGAGEAGKLLLHLVPDEVAKLVDTAGAKLEATWPLTGLPDEFIRS